MAYRIARSHKAAGAGATAGLVLGLLTGAAAAWAQGAPAAAPSTPAPSAPAPSAPAPSAPAPSAPAPIAVAPSPYSPECQTGGSAIAGEQQLPNVTAALEKRKTIRILAIGASAGRRQARGSYTEQIERLLEQAMKGIDVVMINRGVSGELAADAATRIKNEVALEEPDLVLWQIGTNDALAYVPLAELEETITETIRWLKEHKVDVVIAGLQFTNTMAQDSHYAAVRELMRRIAAKENVIIVRRYEAMQLMTVTKRGSEFVPDEFERTDAGYSCLAQYFARVITLGVFGAAAALTPVLAITVVALTHERLRRLTRRASREVRKPAQQVNEDIQQLIFVSSPNAPPAVAQTAPAAWQAARTAYWQALRARAKS
jgi:acyl-CoA thioesterase I